MEIAGAVAVAVGTAFHRRPLQEMLRTQRGLTTKYTKYTKREALYFVYFVYFVVQWLAVGSSGSGRLVVSGFSLKVQRFLAV